MMNKTPQERFKSKLQLRDSGCIEFIGGTSIQGYGKFWVDGATIHAHMYAWLINNGPIPENMSICHHCDNPPCCNIEHLFLGTHQDNMRDKHIKGGFTGERNGNAKLTIDKVRKIKQLIREANHTQYELAVMYNVAPCTINHISTGYRWAHVEEL